jgi:hypothetical protein
MSPIAAALRPIVRSAEGAAERVEARDMEAVLFCGGISYWR